MADINLGLVGTGNAAEYHARYAALSKGFSVASVTSRNKRRAEEFAFRHGIPKAFDDVEYLMEGSDIDFLVIANETKHHFSLAQTALLRGLGVIVEIPVTCTLREAKALVETAEEEGSFLFVANPLLDMPGVQYLKEVLKERTLGEPKEIHLEMSKGKVESRQGFRQWKAEDLLGGKYLQEDAATLLDLLSYFVGFLSFEKAEEEGDHFSIFLHSGDVSCSLALCPMERKFLRMEVLCERGRVVIENNTLLEWTSEVPCHKFVSGMQNKEKTLFLERNYLEKTYSRIREDIERGVPLEGSFERIFLGSFMMEILTLCEN